MVLSTSSSLETEIFYPSRDGEPVAETYDHFYAIMITLEVLRQYLSGTQATVLANQFLYYAQGLPKLRIAPDVMVIFGVTPGGRDNYKIWEEGQVPSVVFEMTSKGTKEQDLIYKKTLYEQLGVSEYWLFDPRGEWVPERLRGYRLHEDVYYPIGDGISQPLKLRLVLEEKLIGFYRQDTGEKLLIPDELAQALQNAKAQSSQERQRAEQERQRADQERQRAERFAEQLRKLGVDPDGIA
jgi:Uma2 family endonuclease